MKKVKFGELDVGDEFEYAGTRLIKMDDRNAKGVSNPASFIFNRKDLVGFEVLDLDEVVSHPLPSIVPSEFVSPLDSIPCIDPTEFGNLTKSESALNQINSRILAIRQNVFLIKIVEETVFGDFLGHLNDQITRNAIAETIEMRLKIALGLWVRELKIVCDETNNTPMMIDQGDLGIRIWLEMKCSHVKNRFDLLVSRPV